jgi:hypothetical protein
MRPRTLKEVVRRASRNDDWRTPLSEFLDAFYAATGDRVTFVEDEPEVLHKDLADAFIGGVGEHLARRWDMAVPAWVIDPRRYLDAPYYQPDVDELKAYLIRSSPIGFRTRQIYLGAEPLQRKGFNPGSELTTIAEA